MKQQEKKQYRTPKVQDWGTVTDLTATGQTQSGPDLKSGSGTAGSGI